ncbi:MAG: SDR family oxidoreductase [Acuticoccus sp.]
MTVLVLGAGGMLGLALCRELAARLPGGARWRRACGGARPRIALPPGLDVAPHVDALQIDSINAALERFRPHTVINAIGFVKNRGGRDEIDLMLAVNGLFPHQLAERCRAFGARLIHFSSDCVFSGTRGAYRETDPPDAQDVYGHSKALGEVTSRHALTLRTSMIGLPGFGGRGLLGWFLDRSDPVKGFTNAVFSGPTAPELARLVAHIITARGPYGGLLHVAAAPIDKFTLLSMLGTAFARDTEIVPDGALRIDRSLRADRLAARYGYSAPSWPAMVDELAAEWRSRSRTNTPAHALA